MVIHVNHRRQQWPVGHGFFHTASVTTVVDSETYRYIYDCGSHSSTLVEDRIDRFALNEKIEGREPELDMLVLSHFHNDHINGVPHLLSRFSVKKLVVPFLSQDFELTALANLAASGLAAWNTFSGLILNPQGWLRDRGHNETEVTRIRRDRPADVAPDQAPDLDGIVLPAGDVSHQMTGTIGKASVNFWDFKFYVQEDYERYLLILAALVDTFAPSTEQQLLNWFSDPVWVAANYAKVKDVFKSLGPHSQNPITLCMYSGPASSLDVHGYFSWPTHSALLHHSSTDWKYEFGIGWLATGDAKLSSPAAFDDFRTHYKVYLGSIDMLTIPHHGAIGDYCGRLGDLSLSTLLTSDHVKDPAGHHPNEAVITNLRSKSNFIFIVTKDMDTAVFYTSEIYVG